MNLSDKLHDCEIDGYRYYRESEVFELYLHGREPLRFDQTVFFDIDGAALQNVIFEIRHYPARRCPSALVEDFPDLAFYQSHPQPHDVYHITPSAGLAAVIVCRQAA